MFLIELHIVCLGPCHQLHFQLSWCKFYHTINSLITVLPEVIVLLLKLFISWPSWKYRQKCLQHLGIYLRKYRAQTKFHISDFLIHNHIFNCFVGFFLQMYVNTETEKFQFIIASIKLLESKTCKKYIISQIINTLKSITNNKH